MRVTALDLKISILGGSSNVEAGTKEGYGIDTNLRNC